MSLGFPKSIIPHEGEPVYRQPQQEQEQQEQQQQEQEQEQQAAAAGAAGAAGSCSSSASRWCRLALLRKRVVHRGLTDCGGSCSHCNCCGPPWDRVCCLVDVHRGLQGLRGLELSANLKYAAL